MAGGKVSKGYLVKQPTTGHGDHDGATYYGEEQRQAKIKKREEEYIREVRKRMNFPAEVERTSTINIGSSNQDTDEETSTSNKGSTYNRNSKRGTRLVRSNKNG